MIGLVNFGLGNLGSIVNCYEKLNIKIKILNDASEIENVSHLILPGVGSFRVGMDNLKKFKWDLEIFKHVEKNKPLWVFVWVCNFYLRRVRKMATIED